MPTFRDIVGYRPSQARRLLRRLNNRTNPSPSPQPSQTLFPGGDVRLLTTVPPQILGDARIPIHQAPANSTNVKASGPALAEESRALPYPAALNAVHDRIGPSVVQLAETNDTPRIAAPTEPHPIADPVRVTPPAGLVATKPHRSSRPRIKRKAIAAPEPSRSQTNLSYHEPRCAICNHPEREAIEQGFLHWQRPSALAHEFGINQRRSIYRHAHALGLFHKRASRSRRTLEFIMEQAETVKATADSVIRAVKAHACLSEDGRWTEPRKEIILTVRYERIGESSPHAPAADPPALLPAVQVSGMKISIPCPEAATGGRRASLATVLDGNTVPSKNAATPVPPTKLQKLMATLSRSCRQQKIASKKEAAIA